jgi:hypothetical protein
MYVLPNLISQFVVAFPGLPETVRANRPVQRHNLWVEPQGGQNPRAKRC